MAEIKIADGVQRVYVRGGNVMTDSEGKNGRVTSAVVGKATGDLKLTIAQGSPADAFPVIDLRGSKLSGLTVETGKGAVVTIAHAPLSSPLKVTGVGAVRLVAGTDVAVIRDTVDPRTGGPIAVPLQADMAAMALTSNYNKNTNTITISSSIRLREGKDAGSTVVERATAKGALDLALVSKGAKFEVVYVDPEAKELQMPKDLKPLFAVDGNLKLAQNQKTLKDAQDAKLNAAQKTIENAIADIPAVKFAKPKIKTRVVEPGEKVGFGIAEHMPDVKGMLAIADVGLAGSHAVEVPLRNVGGNVDVKNATPRLG